MKSSQIILKTTFSLLSMTLFTIMVTSGLMAEAAGTIISSGFAFSSIDWEGGDNIGGFTSEAYLGLYHEIEEFPTLPSEPGNDVELTTMSGNYVMKADKHFIRIYVTPKTFGGQAENQGEIDGKSFLQQGEFFYPGSREEAMAFARKINNARGILIGIDPNTGKRIQFGSREFPCHFKPKIEYGAEPTARRGLTVEFEADNFVPGMFYPGAIPLSEGEMPATT